MIAASAKPANVKQSGIVTGITPIAMSAMRQVGSDDQFRRLEGLLSPVIRMLLNDQAGVAEGGRIQDTFRELWK